MSPGSAAHAPLGRPPASWEPQQPRPRPQLENGGCSCPALKTKESNACFKLLYEVPRAVKFKETESRMAGARGRGREGSQVSDGDRAPVWEDEEVLETGGGDGCATL